MTEQHFTSRRIHTSLQYHICWVFVDAKGSNFYIIDQKNGPFVKLRGENLHWGWHLKCRISALYLYPSIYLYLYIYMYICIRLYIYVYIYIYTYMYMYIKTKNPMKQKNPSYSLLSCRKGPCAMTFHHICFIPWGKICTRDGWMFLNTACCKMIDS